MPAPPGNTNYIQGRRWKDAILRALQKRSRSDQIEALDDLAEKLIQGCEAGDIAFLKEMGNRMDGKATQQIDATVRGNLAFILGSIGKSAGNDPPVEG